MVLIYICLELFRAFTNHIYISLKKSDFHKNIIHDLAIVFCHNICNYLIFMARTRRIKQYFYI